MSVNAFEDNASISSLSQLLTFHASFSSGTPDPAAILALHKLLIVPNKKGKVLFPADPNAGSAYLKQIIKEAQLAAPRPG